MKNYRILVLFAVLALAVSCGKNARVSGVVKDSQNDTLVVKMLSGSKYVVLDTVKTSQDGKFSCKFPVAKGQPEFVYIFNKEDKQLAALIVEAGDKIGVETDAAGNYSVSGSPESEKLKDVEKEFSEFMAEISKLDNSADVVKTYVDYYRNSVKYVMNNPFSLSVIPVLFHEMAPGLPVFNQLTDGLIFKSTSDSLLTVYPDSKYVKNLVKEAEKRMNAINLQTQVKNAGEVGFPDIEMPDINGKKVKLSEVDSKVIILYFWTSMSDDQKMGNLDFMKPLYEEFHDKGLEIYAISLDPDKAAWASIVKNQQLPWINVNDGMGTASRCVGVYGITSVPRIIIIVDGEIVSDVPTTEAEFRKYLALKLK